MEGDGVEHVLSLTFTTVISAFLRLESCIWKNQVLDAALPGLNHIIVLLELNVPNLCFGISVISVCLLAVLRQLHS